MFSSIQQTCARSILSNEILGRDLGPSGVSPNQRSRWKLAGANGVSAGSSLARPRHRWTLSHGLGESMPSRRLFPCLYAPFVRLYSASLLATKTCLTYAFVTQQPFGIPNWNLDTCIFVAWTIRIFHHAVVSVIVLAVLPQWYVVMHATGPTAIASIQVTGSEYTYHTTENMIFLSAVWRLTVNL